ncbi:hypothetical protein D9M68_817910 [compost metagenome]
MAGLFNISSIFSSLIVADKTMLLKREPPHEKHTTPSISPSPLQCEQAPLMPLLVKWLESRPSAFAELDSEKVFLSSSDSPKKVSTLDLLLALIGF